MAKNDKKAKELDNIEADRKKKQAEFDKKTKEQEKKQKKKIKYLINFPYKTIFQISLLSGIIYFTVLYFGQSIDLFKSIYSGAILFLAVLLGLGIIVTTFILIISDRKETERKLKEEEEAELQKLEDERRQQELKAAEEEIMLNEKDLNNNIGKQIEDDHLFENDIQPPIVLPGDSIEEPDLISDLDNPDMQELNDDFN